MNEVSDINNILVSVCVVTYNHEDYIKQCLDGILKQQTNFEYEIILGEDESSDATRSICKEYAEKYPHKIRLFLRSREDVIYINERPTGRYNFIENLKACKGKYVALCEGDDYWIDPLKLQKQVDALETNPNINICFTKAQVLSNGKQSLQEINKDFIETPFSYKELLRLNNFITTASVVFRKPEKFSFPVWFPNLPYGDMGLYKLVSNENDFYCLDHITTVYRVHERGLYSGLNKLKSRQNYFRFYKAIYPYLSKEEKKVSKTKMQALKKEIARLRFPKRALVQFFYRTFYSILFNNQ